MENIEEKLKTYRLRKRRQEKIKQFKESIKGFLMFGVGEKNDEHMNRSNVVIQLSDNNKDVLPQPNVDSDVEHNSESEGSLLSLEEETAQNKSTKGSLDRGSRILKYTLRVVYIAFWTTLYIIAIELQFGIIFLMFSALAAIYLNTRTGPKKPNEISAYSVFNKNCESIDGTLKAEQFEREIGIR